MLEPPFPPDEAQRLATLHALKILDTSAEERFDRITRIVQRLFAAPIALVSLVDTNRQWFKSCQGLAASETPRSISFCGHAILQDQALVIPDAVSDPRFADNPLVTGPPYIRFYAGQPLLSPDGYRLGTLCVIDSVPRQMGPTELQALRDLGVWAQDELGNVQISQAMLIKEESEARIRAVLEHVAEGIITLDGQGQIRSSNPAAERIFGYAEGELIGQNLRMLIPETTRGGPGGYLNEYRPKAAAEVAGSRHEVEGRRKDRVPFPLDLAVSQMALRNEELFIAVVRDISERKRAEEELLFRKVLLECQSEASPDGILVISGDRQRVSFNRRLIEMWGLPEQVLASRSNRTVMKWLADQVEDQRAFVAKIRYLFKHPDAVSRDEVVLKNGRVFDRHSAPIRSPEGVDYGRVWYYRDITEQKRADARLRESEERYRDLFENASDLIQSVGPDGHFLFVNRTWRETLGYNQEEVAGLSIWDVIHPDCVPHCQRLFQRVMAGEQVGKVTAEFVTREGRRIFVEGGVNCKFEDGKPTSSRSIFRDVTERHEVERLKDEFVSTVSHELRTPLTAIRGSMGLLAGGVGGQLSPQAKSLVEMALNNSERLVRLVNDILDIEKIAAGKMEFHLQAMELMPIVERALAANLAYAEQFKVRLELEHAVPGVQVEVDEDRLMQVLTNLLSNAAKFSPTEGVVMVSVVAGEQDVRVSVSDRGPGIPEEFQPRIFQKFAQADSSTTRRKGGTGLGLSICKSIIERLGGQIGFESRPGQGTTFYFQLPQHRSPTTAAPLRILICEDSPLVALRLDAMLRSEGFETDVASSAAQAKELLAQGRYSAMTLDLGLPDQDGLSLLRELRQQEHSRSLPVIVVSAREVQGERKSEVFAISDWFDKSLDQDQLVEAIKRVIKMGENT